jgi:proline racemase
LRKAPGTGSSRILKRHPSAVLGTLAVLLASLACLACKKKETAFEMETPAGGIKVEKDVSSGKVEVEIEDEEK